MTRHIDAEELKANLRQYFSDGTLDSVSAKLAFNMILRKIDEAPTIEIPNYGGQVVPDTLQGWRYEERQQGEWILKETDCDNGGNNRYECSKCHYSDIHSVSAEVPYCWHCGSGMKGGVE